MESREALIETWKFETLLYVGRLVWLDILEVWNTSTGWLYQLIQKHLLIYSTKLHLNDFYAPPLPLSNTDIWYLVSNNPEICQISCKIVPRKKVRFLELAQIGQHSDAQTLNFGLKTQINSWFLSIYCKTR